MPTNTDIVNLALQSFGSRTTVTDAELLAGSTNEAKQANLVFASTRDSLFRLAPWNCSLFTSNLVYITSAPGTPENPSPSTPTWQPGQPSPPWLYEYQYPVNCLRACWIIPGETSNYTGTPISPVSVGAPALWLTDPIRFKVQMDNFISFSSAAIAVPGTGYFVNDVLKVEDQTPPGEAPHGAQGEVFVTAVNGSGGLVTVVALSQLPGSTPAYAGSYFNPPINPVAIVSGYNNQTFRATLGSGAVLNVNTSIVPNKQRVILTNQQNATLVYVRSAEDPATWDTLFEDAMVESLASKLCMSLTGDKAMANMCIRKANQAIEQARSIDGNEGFAVDDRTPDWIRARGFNWGVSNGIGFNWGGLLSNY